MGPALWLLFSSRAIQSIPQVAVMSIDPSLIGILTGHHYPLFAKRAAFGEILKVRVLRTVVLIVLACLFGCVRGVAQGFDRTIAQFAHTAWGPKEGAPSPVTALAQTSDGYLWLGSPDGLYRFDGVVFERYQPQSGGPFPARRVSSLLALPNGDLWIGFMPGAVSLLRNGNATNYTVRDGVPGERYRASRRIGRERFGLRPAAGWRGWRVTDGRKWGRIGISRGRLRTQFFSMVREDFGFLPRARWFFFRRARGGFSRRVFESAR